jgi:hypothetical protein
MRRAQTLPRLLGLALCWGCVGDDEGTSGGSTSADGMTTAASTGASMTGDTTTATTDASESSSDPSATGETTTAPATSSTGDTSATAETAATGGGMGDCESCVECTNTNCGDQLTTCAGNPECQAIYDCAAMCLPDGVEPCIEMHVDGVPQWAMVSQCINENCLEICSY